MSKLDKSKERYDDIQIPDELNQVVLKAIKQSERKRKAKSYRGWGAAIAASLAIATTVGVNTNEAFAKEMQKIPVIGQMIKVLTIRSYEQKDDGFKISVEVPGLEAIENDMSNLPKAVNAEISKKCSEYAEEAKQRAEEYKKAFIDTGGTEAEWEEHHIEIKVWYEIKNQSRDYLSFAVYGTENWTSAFAETSFYNLDLKSMQYLTLRNLLGDQYIQRANESIKAQIKAREEAEDVSFWTGEEGGFETIGEQTRFYINAKGNPVIVYGKYEIAPGTLGEVEFEIER